MDKEVMLYDKLENNNVQCKICSHRCKIAPGKMGFCRVRENRDGTLYALNYNIVSSEGIDPIEKKPLYHFYPGSYSYSLGTIGCNFKCKHCQNWMIAQCKLDESQTFEITPEQAIDRALNFSADSISWTYNEPAIWFEYTYDSAKLAKEKDLSTVYVTNGYVTTEALKLISPYLDAYSVDIKAFNEEFYKDVSSAKLQPVLESTKLAKELGMHVEITYLVIPTLNDTREEIQQFSRWVLDNLGDDTPVHFSRFHPFYKMKDYQPTPIETLELAYDVATSEGLKYVYLGNVMHRQVNTFCPNCGKMLIKRGMGVEQYNISDNNTCVYCGEYIPMVTGLL
ncbi:MAG: AmmeMemoRadiSam system radical SAM enzyme [Methanohalobium sp.]|uniref:AmmeMemoRadiSam system radical SAM enzyme n=1 Tax=Methanohalobium sp. TaxID=2837493 RepID=UPI00397D2702